MYRGVPVLNDSRVPLCVRALKSERGNRREKFADFIREQSASRRPDRVRTRDEEQRQWWMVSSDGLGGKDKSETSRRENVEAHEQDRPTSGCREEEERSLVIQKLARHAETLIGRLERGKKIRFVIKQVAPRLGNLNRLLSAAVSVPRILTGRVVSQSRNHWERKTRPGPPRFTEPRRMRRWCRRCSRANISWNYLHGNSAASLDSCFNRPRFMARPNFLLVNRIGG